MTKKVIMLFVSFFLSMCVVSVMAVNPTKKKVISTKPEQVGEIPRSVRERAPALPSEDVERDIKDAAREVTGAQSRIKRAGDVSGAPVAGVSPAGGSVLPEITPPASIGGTTPPASVGGTTPPDSVGRTTPPASIGGTTPPAGIAAMKDTIAK